jgi:hypothetical protein
MHLLLLLIVVFCALSIFLVLPRLFLSSPTLSSPILSLNEEAASAAFRVALLHAGIQPPGVANWQKTPIESTPHLQTLVVLIGNLRGGRPTFQSLLSNLVVPNNAHLALIVPEGSQPTAATRVLHEAATYVWTHQDFGDDWEPLLDSMGGDNSWRAVADNNVGRGTFAPRPDDPEGSGLIVMGLRDLVRRIMFEELQLDKVYDRFVVTRSDQFYPCELDLRHFDNEHVWIPVGQDWAGGLCDRWVLANSSVINDVLDIIAPVVLHPDRYLDWRGNCESLWKRSLELKGLMPSVRRFERPMFTAAVEGDPTRWSVATPSIVDEGVLLKYPEEYGETKLTCSRLVAESK